MSLRRAVLRQHRRGRPVPGHGHPHVRDQPRAHAAGAALYLPDARKGGKFVTIPLAPRTARAIDLAIGERTEGPMFLGGDGKRLDRHGAARIVRRVTRRAGIAKKVSPHTLRHAFITAAQFRRRGPAPRRAGGRLPRRPPHHHALRPGAHEPGQARHLHRRRLHRRSSPIAETPGLNSVWPPCGGQTVRTPAMQSLRATS